MIRRALAVWLLSGVLLCLSVAAPVEASCDAGHGFFDRCAQLNTSHIIDRRVA